MLPLLGLAQTNSKVDLPNVGNTSSEKQPLEIKRNATYNLEEIKVRWKKAALENCPGVPCVTAPSFTCVTSTVTDVDGNIYNTVALGTGTTAQCWTASNLKVTKYNDGTVIPDETANTGGWGGLATGARSDYTGEASYIATYGYLYNWYAAKGIATAGSTTYKNICPTGWHVPTDGEWTSLIQFTVPTETVSATVIGIQSPNAGGKLKSSSLWYTAIPPAPGTDNFGFTALPGGVRYNDGSVSAIRGNGFFWSATDNFSNAWYRYLSAANINVYRGASFDKSVGFSVRCLRD